MKNYKSYLFWVFSLVVISNTYAQECGFDQQREKLLENPSYVAKEKSFEQKIQNFIAEGKSAKIAGDVLTIPVVIHVLHKGEAVGSGSNISDAQIQSSIDNLNYFYRGQSPDSPIDFEIEFVLAQRDPNCNPSNGINRVDASGVPNYSEDGIKFNTNGSGAEQNILKDLSRWSETDYFNIWIVSEIEGNNGGSGFQGYANFYYGNNYEGSVMMATVFGFDPTNSNPSWNLNFSRDNSTVVHEAGHYFHLYHTFQGDDTNNDNVSDSCPADITLGVDSDGCADTVPHKRETSTCPSTNSCTGSPWVDDNTINNIMSYYRCTDKLTNDQRTRVRGAMEGTSIIESSGAKVLDPNFVAPIAVCNTNTAAANNFAGIINVELNGIANSSSTTGNDGGNKDGIISCANIFEIDATESNTLNVGVGGNVHQIGVWIDWNNDGDFEDDAEQQYYAQNIVSNSVVPIGLTYPAMIPYNEYVRVRIIEELDDQYGNGITLINSPCYQNLVYGQSEDYAIYVKPSTSTTYTYDNGWLPNNPIGIATMYDDIMIMNGNAIVSNNMSSNTISVNEGAAITVNSGITLTTNIITLNSTSETFSSLILNGNISGSVNYNRYTASVGPVGSNDLISAPLSGQTFGSFSMANPELAASGTLRLFGPYVTVNDAYENYDTFINEETVISEGVGFRAATNNGSPLTFTGAPLSSDVLDIPISDASAGNAWNLIGNPYPSYIDFDTFFQLNKSEFDSASPFQAIYGYDGDASNGWTVWNQATIADTNITELIAPGQGFFVKAKANGGLVDFTTAMRVIGSSNDFITDKNVTTNTIASGHLKIANGSKEASTKIYFIEGTTRGLDAGYDAGAYFSAAAEFSIFTNLVENSTGLDLAIQTLPLNDVNDIVVPVGINAIAGIQLTVEFDETSSLPNDVSVYFEDRTNNTFTLLNDSNYVFTPSSNLNGIGRFYMHYSSATLTVRDDVFNSLDVFFSDLSKSVIIQGEITDVTVAKLYDIQGRLVFQKKLDESSNRNVVNVSNVTSGIYIISIANDNQKKTQKIIIK